MSNYFRKYMYVYIYIYIYIFIFTDEAAAENTQSVNSSMKSYAFYIFRKFIILNISVLLTKQI